MATKHVLKSTQVGQPNKHHAGCYSWNGTAAFLKPLLLDFKESVHVWVCMWGHEGSLLLPFVSIPIWRRQSQPSQRQTVGSRTEEEEEVEGWGSPSAAPQVNSLCVYTHDGSRPHCDVLFMPYQFIMTRRVSRGTTLTRTRAFMIETVIEAELVFLCTLRFTLKNV